MSDESDSQDEMGSDVAEYEDYESDSPEAEEGNPLVDDEAEESDGYDHDDDEDEDGYDDDDADGKADFYHDRQPLSEFPQFARLPFELRAMIWELVDPYLRSPQRVMELNVVGSKETGLSPWAFLEQQTEPARTLLAVNRESRELALKYYPDVVKLGGRLGHVRYNKATDIVLMHIDLESSPVLHLKSWCDGIKYLGVDLTMWGGPPPTLRSVPDGSDSIEVIFYCFGARDDMISRGQSDWVMSESTNTFMVETFEESPGVGEDLKHTVYWPDLKGPDLPLDETIPFGFAIWPTALHGPCRVLPMAIFDFDADRDSYRTLRNRVAKQNGASSPVYSSDGTSVYESEADDYEIGDFVVNTPPEQSEDASDDEGEDETDVDAHPDTSLLQVDSGDDLENSDEFNGVSPAHGDLGDEEETGEVPNAAFSSLEPESPREIVTIPSSDDDEPQVPKQQVRGKRRIVFDDEDEESGADNGADESGMRTQPRPTKRARVLLSDSEEEEEMPGRSRKRRAAPADSSEDSSEGNEEVEEEERPRSMSLLERLRQFRSDNPISPEDENSDQSEEDDEGGDLGYGDGGEPDEYHGGHYDEELPESGDDEESF
ncbi:hypothetical protein F5Y18DRAFT_260610 [Xylariaceae sp. FL1019]|nr:hypothetical protein F5Y18DRAFT_260610 [Xylariaceae sp. FL1019]